MILDLLEENRNKNPSKVVLVDENESMTIGDFVKRARELGTEIAKLGFKNRAVAVESDRSIYSLVGFYAAMYSGNFFMPVDSKTPKKRLEMMTERAKPVAYLSVNEDGVFSDYETIDTRGSFSADDEILKRIRENHIDIDPCYLIWTSGSTGEPKGVLINHSQILELVKFLKETFEIDEKDVLGCQSPFYFDGAMKDVFLFGACGVKLVVIPQKYFALPINLVEFLNENRVNVLLWAVSALNILVNSKVLEKNNLKYVNKISFAGESFQTSKLNYLMNKVDAKFVNLYGPSETTVDCAYYVVDRKLSDDEIIPIGKSIPNMEIFLVDEDLKESSEKGEIVVRGSKISCGYYRDEGRTNLAFIQDPRQDFFRDIVYRTGDIAKYNERGELVFLSRSDDQIKHMGSRIELGEIEASLSSMEEIEEGACIYDFDDEKIVFFYSGEEIKRRNIIVFLRDRIPKYMFPSEIVHLERLPKNRNGKIDRNELRTIYEKNKGNWRVRWNLK